MSILSRLFSKAPKSVSPAPSIEEIWRMVAEEAIERRNKVFPKLSPGFTFAPSGRAGYIYFKEDGRMIEFDCEMSGVPEYDILLWPGSVKEWHYPEKSLIPEARQTEILEGLKIWLRKQKLRSDLERPEPPR